MRPPAHAYPSPEVLRLLVAYDGTAFSGYQVQPGQRTVQGVLIDALSTLAGAPVRLRAAGRTDAGVHALGQVVSVDEPGRAHPDVVMRAMPSLLPEDVSVLDAQPAPEGFDARHSARSRAYVYLLWCGTAPHPLHRHHALWVRETLDLHLLEAALRLALGTHDFSSFARLRPDQSPVRTVLEACAEAEGSFVRIRVVGESFLHQMVRSIVGTALEVATGRKTLAWMREAVAARDRSAAGPVAPPYGLTLVDVGYDDAPWPRREPSWPWTRESESRTVMCS